MITKMTKYSWILLSSAKDGFLESISELGIVDITRSTKPVDDTSAQLLEEIEKAEAELQCIESGTSPEIDSLQASYADTLLKEAGLEPWGKFDPEKLSGFNPHFYIVPTKKFNPQWEQEAALQIVEERDGKTYFVTLAQTLPLQETPAPQQNADAVHAQAESILAQIEECRKALTARKEEIPILKERLNEKINALNLYLAGLAADEAAESHITVFEGFAPSSEDESLKSAFDSMDLYWTSEEAKTVDNPPIKFKNNRFVRMFEMLTDMYGRPDYDGFDPTPYISVFFLLFFAMCMGDAGYGLILVVIGLLLKKVKSFANLSPLVITLGVGTVVVGFLFHTFFSIDISQWACIPDSLKSIMLPAKIGEYDGAMVLALALGVVHISLALIVKTVNSTKRNGFLGSLGTWGWTLLIIGGIIVGALAFAGVMDSSLTKIVVIALGSISALGIFIFNDLHRNVFKNIGSGLWEAYNTATGLLGDVLSYLRLYALGLAGSMLGCAFNDLAKLALGDGGTGWIPFILIAVTGHVLNIAMAALGAFVHPLRLNLLEFFKNSGYEGSGRTYNPLNKQSTNK